ncbi:hypothetical protein A8713_19070 [Streptomyces sp. SAT1]|uniref:protein kinase n=1 Tax=Streptomyces sp. SAT1 TaxID=1849967 RepID=UPI0007DD8DBF|nr:protein kinase [Streptomyces sp. SAT1]ANH93007.1 hypothetical protein A8713_19070 [Streptomyces sp. SAT1]
MDDYAGRVLADRYRLPLPPSDAYELTETRAFDTYSGQEVLLRQVPLPEVVEAEVLDADGLPEGFTARDGVFRGPGALGGRTGRTVPPARASRAEPGATRRPADPAVRRAIEAAQAAARIPDHPRLDQVFDVFAEDGSLWIASELVAARPLSALLADRPLTPYRAAEVASDLLMALRVLHGHGWVHRNITARTVLVCDDGRVMLTGLAVGAAEEALCGYDPVPAPDGEGDAAREGGGFGGYAGFGADGGESGTGGGADAPAGPGGIRDALDERGYGGPPGGAASGAASGTASDTAPGTGFGVDPEAARRAAIEARAAGALPLPGGGPDSGGAAGELVRSTPPSGDDIRAARAGAIAAYRAGARAAARVQEAQRGARAALPGARPPAEGENRAAPPGQIADPYGVRATPRPGAVGADDTPPAGGVPRPGSTEDAEGFAGPADAGDAGDAGDGGAQGRPALPPSGSPDPWWSTSAAAPPASGAPGSAPYALGPGGPEPYALGRGAPDPSGRGPSSRGPSGVPPEDGPAVEDGRTGAPYPGGRAVDAPATGDRDRDRHRDPYGGPAPSGGAYFGARPVTGVPAARDPYSGDRPAPDRPASDRPASAGAGPGSALAAERARQARMTVVGPVTERWAPEQAGPVHANWQLAAPIGPATDLWALGALLFRAVQGHAPYPEESTAELVQLVCAEPPAFAEECGALRPVVESLLRQDPTERLDFEELGGWLRSLVRSAPEPEAGAHVVAAPPADPKRLPIVRRRGELVRRRRAGLPAHHGRHKRGGREGRSPRSLGRILLLLVLLLLAGAVAFAMLFLPKSDRDTGGGRPDTGRTGGASDAPAPPDGSRASGTPGGGRSAADGGGSPSQSSGAAETQTTGAGVPGGFTVRKDAAGFRIAVASGWNRTPGNDRGQVVYSRGDFELIVVPGRDTAKRYGGDPMVYQREDEYELRDYRDSSWATSSGLRTTQVGGRTMAEGQFTWSAGGRQLFVRNLALLLDGRYHVVQVRGPESQRDQVDKLYEQATATYRYTG